MRSKGKHIIWPAYFDSSLSREDGRRVSKNTSSRAPNTDEIIKAAVAAGLKAELQPRSAHPRTPYIRTGYVLVEAKVPKTKAINLIALKLSNQST